jgi:spore germination cell wall hydrolase CwlJ-like protein
MNTNERGNVFLVCLFSGLVILAVSEAHFLRQARLLNKHQQAEFDRQKVESDKKIHELTELSTYYQNLLDDERNKVERKEQDKRDREEAKKRKAQFVLDEIRCLADNIFHEAGYEPEAGQLAVATVTMNRVGKQMYQSTVCGVVYQRAHSLLNNKTVCSFSWTCKPWQRTNDEVYKHIYEMAKRVYTQHERSDEVPTATLYHANYVHPSWADKAQVVASIGLHIFYVE